VAIQPHDGARRLFASRRSMLAGTAAGLLAGAGTIAIGDAASRSPAAAATATTPAWINVVSYGADPSGAADSTSAIQAAIKALPATGGVIYLPAGTYKVTGTLTCTTVPAYFLGDGAWATVLAFSGTGDCVRIYDPTTYSSRTSYSGGFCAITIDGQGAGAGSAGLHVGDLLQYELDMTVQNFSGAGSIGVHLDNTYYWTEQLHGQVYTQNCTSHVVFDCTGTATTASGSFDRCDLGIYIDHWAANGDGVVFTNGANIGNGSLRIRGNFSSSSSPVSSAALRLTGSLPSGHEYSGASGILNGLLDIGVECGTGAYTPQAIVFGSSANTIYSCYGALNFGVGSYQNFSKGNNAGNIFDFRGQVVGDSSLPGQWATYSSGFPSGWTGHVSVRFLPTGNEVMISWAFDIAAGTAATTYEAITTLASQFHYTDNKFIPGNIAGGGLTGNAYAPAVVSPTGVLQYEGPSFTASGGTAWWYGQGVYTLSLG
jgi:Pectate lyase superfamily protein